MKRIAILAHYDKKNIIDDYVLFCINELKRVCNEVVFVSCCDLSENELNKLDCHKISKEHNEYDFGSYKRGFVYAKENNLLENCDEILFLNDSCYGPFKPLDKIFEKMNESSCDFWGFTKNKYAFKIVKKRTKDCFIPHIQSYFFVLKSNVFNSQVFNDFINSVKEEESKNKVIEKYEIGLTTVLEAAGFSSDFLIKKFYKYNNPTVYKWRELYEKSDFPFIKCSLLRLNNTLHTTVEGWRDLFTKEQIGLIEKNLEYTRTRKMKHLAPAWFKKFVFNHLPNKKMKLRMLTRALLRSIFAFITD
ncbi:hypothetical protein IJ707_00510 [bacterium]|nr:hypothetical protein [bacterium]